MIRRLWPLALLAIVVPAAPASALTARDGRARAVRAYRALQRNYYLTDQKIYRGTSNSYLWPYSQALGATISVAGLRYHEHGRMEAAVRDRLAGLGRYFDAKAVPQAYSANPGPYLSHYKYYDDNEWVGLELLRRYHQVREPFLLQRAKAIFKLAVFGWDRNSAHACPGGVLFSQRPWNQARNAITNAPAAEMGLRIYQYTHETYYLQWAKRMYDWVRRCLQIKGSELYFDRIDFKGLIPRAVLTYDEGPMLGASVLLYRVTGQARYLKRAQAMAREAMKFFSRGRLRNDPPAWSGILFENLLLLDAVRPNPGYRRYVEAWADHGWNKLRDPATDLFPPNGPQATAVATQSAFAKVFALLATEPAAIP
ncbi:MAG: glycosyl hydrolase [Actinobacteria bacterium]|nr:MAG: glycosyl hydrolase [Actinomycetota bacterium]